MHATASKTQNTAMVPRRRFTRRAHPPGVTGFAGRAGPDDEPGLAHFALSAAGAPTVHEEHHFGDIGRGPVRLECLRVALRMLEDAPQSVHTYAVFALAMPGIRGGSKPTL